jgi:molybdopterin converting factor subunit 1
MGYVCRVRLKLFLMQVRVLFFGMLKELVGKSSDLLELGEGSSVRDLLMHYNAALPGLKTTLPSLAIAVNQQYAGPATRLKQGDEVALLPPVSGGACDSAGETPALQPAGRRRYSSLVRDGIDTQGLVGKLKMGDDGAVVVFEGVVRNQTRGRRTLYLEYEAYEEMALQRMEWLAEHALQQFQIRDVTLIHRLGKLEVGETSVMIAVASAHRAAAFEACRWLIDTLKQTVPIWKKEHFEDGTVWSDGEPFPAQIPQANSGG